MVKNSSSVQKEGKAFSKRIIERTNAGFIPDVRRAVKCDYFYKSFFRDPYYIKLFLVDEINVFLKILKKHSISGAKILDAGCGPGYSSLEFARAGYNVTAIDVAKDAIKIAKKTLSSNPYKENFGSLVYKNIPFQKASGKYDVIIFGGVLHHFTDLEKDILYAKKLLKPRGLLLCREPIHEKWRMQDAAQVSLIRGLLSLTGFWYEESLGKDVSKNTKTLTNFVSDVYTEYINERDKNEPGGQSPNDNSSTGTEILSILRKHFIELEFEKGFSFIYRLLGGMRGPDKVIHKIADFLTFYEKMCIKNGFMESNHFFFAGRMK